jgi:hypothetical protein
MLRDHGWVERACGQPETRESQQREKDDANPPVQPGSDAQQTAAATASTPDATDDEKPDAHHATGDAKRDEHPTCADHYPSTEPQKDDDENQWPQKDDEADACRQRLGGQAWKDQGPAMDWGTGVGDAHCDVSIEV